MAFMTGFSGFLLGVIVGVGLAIVAKLVYNKYQRG